MLSPLLAACLASLALPAAPAPAPANLDESKVPPYTLPDPLLCTDGTRVRDAATWRAKRRPELLELFATQEYGRTPSGRPAKMHWEVTSVDRAALGGKAVRQEITIWFSEKRDGPQMHLLIYQPAGDAAAHAPWPVFLGLNFFGNHAVHADPAISLARPFVFYEADRYRPAPAGTPVTSEQRGVHASKWQIETVIARGYATATAWYHDLCPDRGDGLKENVPALLATGGAEERAGDAWGAIGVWAWGLSRALDVIASDAEFDARRVAVHGHSRLGKAAVWAAAQDERFALLVSNESGCGGAALSQRIYGETVGLINARFPHWFAKNFRRYNDHEAALPFDQHELLALVAPRPLYVASAEGDQWSDPKGEFLGAKGAEPVYQLFGLQGLGVGAMPRVGTPVAGDAIGYHNRTGKHDVTDEDWGRVLDFADTRLKPVK
ncbi:MAG: acetylxylan esterase [Opitutus sp.]|nr:acetylxylan esterase [Opitutus sp.]